MISLTAEYALRAVTHMAAASLAEAEEGPVSMTVGQIASATMVPEGYLSKVMQQLVRAKIIQSQRGAGGGFRLSRAAQEISAYDVVQAVDPIRRIEKCPLGLEAHELVLCPLHKQLDEAARLIEEKFRGTCIVEMIETPQAMEEMRERLNQEKLRLEA
jgi:Rrf2 family nitric oxide-sensitive transcriptional repressor